jgi:2-oxoglutarate dehydrogenase E2 component (dihydrolipoamide succinyltransferase)
MAQIEVKVPQLSESVAEATLLSWHKKVGEAVSRDENLIDIETDKVVLELPAPNAGVIVQLIKNDGATVVAGEVIAIIDTEASAQTSPIGITAAPVDNAPAAVPAPQAASASTGAKGDVAMPAAAKILADNNIAASDATGTGRDGRVTKGDALAAVPTRAGRSCRPGTAGPAGRQAGPAASRRTGPGQPGRAFGRARADEPPARPYRRAPAAIAVDQRHPDHLQRSEHGPGHGPA